MVLFGLVHGVFFPSEIIGTYGIVAVVFAGWFAHKHHKRQLAVCALVLLFQIVTVVLAMLFGPGGEAAASGAAVPVPAAAPTGAGESVASALPWFVTNVNEWFFTALGAAFTTMILPAAFLGARLADGRLVQTIVFVMEPCTPAYEHDTSVNTVAPLIATASGHLGHNIDYLLELDQALTAHHIHDTYIQELIAAVRAYGADI